MNIRISRILIFLLLGVPLFAQESSILELGGVKANLEAHASFSDVYDLPGDSWRDINSKALKDEAGDLWMKVKLPPVVKEAQLYLTENKGVRVWEFYLVKGENLIRYAEIDWSMPYRNTARNGAQFRGLTYASFNQSPGYDYFLYVHIKKKFMSRSNFILRTSENFTRRQQSWSLIQGMGVGFLFMITLLAVVLIFKLNYQVNWLYLLLVLSAGVSIFYISGLGPYLAARILPGMKQYFWYYLLGLFSPMVVLYVKSFIDKTEFPALNRYFKALLMLTLILAAAPMIISSDIIFLFINIQTIFSFLLICGGLIGLVYRKVHAARWMLVGWLLYFFLSSLGYVLSLSFDKRTLIGIVFHLLSLGLLTMLFGGAMILELDEKLKKELSLRESAEEAAKNAIDRMSANERMADLGRLVASVTHELGNPLGVTVTLSTSMASSGKRTFDLFEKKELSEEQFRQFVMDVQQSSELIYRNMEQASQLINGFKMVASDQVVPDIRAFDLREYLMTLKKVLDPVVQEGGCRLELSVEPGLTMTSFPGILTQVLTNLVNNALIHGVEGLRDGSIRIDGRKENDCIVLCVEDNGKGIPSDIQDKIFDIYFTTRKGKGGTGVGLSIVHSLVVEELKGSISFESHPGKGTVFTVLLPENINEI